MGSRSSLRSLRHFYDALQEVFYARNEKALITFVKNSLSVPLHYLLLTFDKGAEKAKNVKREV